MALNLRRCAFDLIIVGNVSWNDQRPPTQARGLFARAFQTGRSSGD